MNRYQIIDPKVLIRCKNLINQQLKVHLKEKS
jgi:hypothetical protein